MPTITVVHPIPGRLRLRVPELKRDPALAERIIAAGIAHPGVRQVRVNLSCASVVVEGERDCVGLIRQNLVIVAAPNATALGLAATVGLSPVAATLLNNGSSIVAAVNSLRPLMANGAPRAQALLGS